MATERSEVAGSGRGLPLKGTETKKNNKEEVCYELCPEAGDPGLPSKTVWEIRVVPSEQCKEQCLFTDSCYQGRK